MTLERRTRGTVSEPGPIILVVTTQPPAAALVEPLQGAGYEVTIAHPDQLADRMGGDWRPDLAIVDNSHSRRNQFLVYTQLRRDPALPILLIVPEAEYIEAQQAEGFNTTVDLYLPASFQTEDLLALVAHQLITQGKILPTAPAPLSSGGLLEPEPGEKPGQLIAVYGTKGGVGKTTIAANLAACLAQSTGAEILITDCDLYFGSVASVLGLNTRRTWLDAAQFPYTQDPALIGEALTTFSHGATTFKAILTPAEPADSEQLQEDVIPAVITAARRYFDCIICDLHSSYDGVTLNVLDRVDQILLVTTPEVGAIRNTTRFLELSEQLGYQEKIRLVINRYNSGLLLEQLQRAVNWPISATLESAGRIAVEAANRGVPFVLTDRNAPITHDVIQLASTLNVRRARRKRPGQQVARWGDTTQFWSRMKPVVPKAHN